MIDPESWTTTALATLKKQFGPRLLYLGLQGSYRRNEATENSDIDLVVILDHLTTNDLETYRQIINTLPENEKACGFISGIAELKAWPKHELFSFHMDTRDYHGNLAELIPETTDEDAKEGARTGASALYHVLAHSYLHAPETERADLLKNAYKSAFFILLPTHYLRTGHYCASKKELAGLLSGVEKTILETGMNFPERLTKEQEREAFAALFDWCGRILSELAAPNRSR